MSDYMISIDQSTSASKVFLMDARGRIVRRYSKPHAQFYPAPGWVEHDADEIWRNVRQGIDEMARAADGPVRAIALSNQRETTVLWDRATGEPLCHAVVWQDVRGDALCCELAANSALVSERTGLPLSPYYPAAKAASVLRANPEIASRARRGEVCIGTIDSYLVYRMTGGRVFKTDLSNASRTQLFDIARLRWDDEICAMFDIPKCCLAEPDCSDGDFGTDAATGIRITGVMGDSHASLFGNGCYAPGTAKATFGTGSSIMLNTGDAPVRSARGLAASIGFGRAGKVCYVLEGNVHNSGDTLRWLRDEAQMIDDIADIESIARSVEGTDGVFMVPGFTGLGAPYFAGQARAAIIGMNRGTTRAHIVRAALESMAYQDADVLDAMAADAGTRVGELMLDGGGADNALLVQLLSDLVGCRVCCAAEKELSATGAAYMAGLSVGMFASYDEIAALAQERRVFEPKQGEDWRAARMAEWRAAVRRVL